MDSQAHHLERQPLASDNPVSPGDCIPSTAEVGNGDAVPLAQPGSPRALFRTVSEAGPQFRSGPSTRILRKEVTAKLFFPSINELSARAVILSYSRAPSFDLFKAWLIKLWEPAGILFEDASQLGNNFYMVLLADTGHQQAALQQKLFYLNNVNVEADVPIGPSAHPITSTVPPLAHSPVPLFRPSSNLNLGGVSTPGGSPSTLPVLTQIGTPLPPVGATLSMDPMLDTGIGNPVGPSDVLVAPLLGPLPVGDSGWYNNGFSSDDTSIRAKSHYSQASETSKPESRRWHMYLSDFDRSMQSFSGMSLSSSRSLLRPGQHRFTNTLQYEQMLHSGQALDLELFKMARSPSTTLGDSALHEGSATASVSRSRAMSCKSGWLSSDVARERCADPKVAARKAFQKQQLEAAAPSSSTHTVHISCAEFNLLITGVYGPSESGVRARLWDSLLDCIPAGLAVLLGDFNQIESPVDSLSGVPLLAEAELQDFSTLKVARDFLDCYEGGPSVTGPWYTRFYIPIDVVAASRIDRIYLSDNGDWTNSILALLHWGGQSLSDHLPVQASIRMPSHSPMVESRPPALSYPSFIVQEEDFQKGLADIWEFNLPMTKQEAWDINIANSRCYIKDYVKRKQLQGHHIPLLEEEVRQLHARVAASGANQLLQSEFAVKLATLRKLSHAKAKRDLARSGLRWEALGDLL
ncbi:unnamed protein product [Calypogeia fissa]